LYPELLLASLQRLAEDWKMATVADRRICQELIRCLEAQGAPPATGGTPEWQHRISDLTAKLAVAEAQRLARLARRRQNKTERRERIRKFTRKYFRRKK
jgi:hypothetical protein